MATFSCWTIGPAKISKCGHDHLFDKDEKIWVSPVHSWLNFILTTGIAIYNFVDYTTSIFFVPTIVLTILLTKIFLLHGDYILCCTCCKCNNNLQYTVLNTANLEEEIPIQETTNQPSLQRPSPPCPSLSCNWLSYFFVGLLYLTANFLFIPKLLAMGFEPTTI